tara:strand:+ start:21288 stop:21467 length:180 start_codon:yes stop_codon:yes gene_type:complete
MIQVPFHYDEFSCGGCKEPLPVTVYNQTSKKYMLLTKTSCFSPIALPVKWNTHGKLDIF